MIRRVGWSQRLSLLAALVGCAAGPPLPPLPPLASAWRQTPVTPHRISPPAPVRWSPDPSWSTVHALRLRNGLQVHLLQRARAEAHVLLVSPSAGLQSHSFDRAALAVARAAMVRTLAAEADGLRPGVLASSSDRGTVFSARGPHGSLRRVAMRVRDALSPEGITDAQIARARDQLAEQRRDRVGLGETMTIAALQQLYGEDSAAARPPVGYSDELRAVRVADVRRAVLRAYATQSAALVVVSDASPVEAQPVLDETLGALTLAADEPAPRTYGTFPAEMQPPILVPSASPLSVVSVACPLGGSWGTDVVAQQAFAAVLGASTGSRLDELVRGQHALVYDTVESEVRNIGGQSILLLTMLPAQREASTALGLLMDQLDDLATHGLSREEAERAVALLLERRTLAWDSPEDVGYLVATDLLAGVTPQAPDGPQILERTPERLRALADRCPVRRLTIAVSGDDETLGEVVDRVGRPGANVRYWRTPQE